MFIYGVKVKDMKNEDIIQLSKKISPYSSEKINTFKFKKDKILTLLGEILVRIKISENYHLPLNEIKFKKNLFGKPYLENKEVEFNIAHSEDIVICGIAKEEIGVDIEKIKQFNYKQIVYNYFTQKERKYVFIKNEEMLERFYEIWTLKESFIKCIGKGLMLPLQSFTIEREEQDFQVFTKDYGGYILSLLDLNKKYKVGICSKSFSISKGIIFERQEDLIGRFNNSCIFS